MQDYNIVKTGLKKMRDLRKVILFTQTAPWSICERLNNAFVVILILFQVPNMIGREPALWDEFIGVTEI
jgi:hypothetical protein